MVELTEEFFDKQTAMLFGMLSEYLDLLDQFASATLTLPMLEDHSKKDLYNARRDLGFAREWLQREVRTSPSRHFAFSLTSIVQILAKACFQIGRESNPALLKKIIEMNVSMDRARSNIMREQQAAVIDAVFAEMAPSIIPDRELIRGEVSKLARKIAPNVSEALADGQLEPLKGEGAIRTRITQYQKDRGFGVKGCDLHH